MYKKKVDNLWLACNKLRESLLPIELGGLLIYALFLKYIDMSYKQDKITKLTILSYDEKFSVAYLALTYGKVIKQKEVLEATYKYESELRLTKHVISFELERLLSKINEESVRILFSNVNEILINAREELYQVALQILSHATELSGKTRESVSSLAVCQLEAALLQCQDNMTLYDGFCGYGMSINEAATNNTIVYMQDTNQSAVAIATVLTMLKGNKLGDIRCGDSYLNPLSKNTYDRIVCEPPLLTKYEKEYFNLIPSDNCIYGDSLDNETLPVRHALARLKEDGIAIVLVPMGQLFKGGRTGAIREKLILDKYIDAVIELPAGVLMPYTEVHVALLILKKNKSDDEIFMLNASKFFEKIEKNRMIINAENINKIVSLYDRKEKVEGISRNTPVSEIAENEFNLCTTGYVLQKPEDTIIVKDISKYQQKYEDLLERLSTIDNELERMRKQWL